MKKAVRAAFAAALVLLAVGIGVVSLSLGKIVKSAVEAAGPRLLGAPVSVGEVVITPWSGRGALRGVVIGNPAGYRSASAISVGSVEIEIKLSSLLTDTIVIERVAVSKPELTWEVGPAGANIDALKANARASAERLGGGGASSAPAASGKGRSLLIRDFSVSGGRVNLALTALGGQGLGGPLPDIRLANLGGKGHPPAEAVAQAVGAIASSAQGAASKMGADAIDAVRHSAFSALQSFFRGSGK